MNILSNTKDNPMLTEAEVKRFEETYGWQFIGAANYFALPCSWGLDAEERR